MSNIEDPFAFLLDSGLSLEDIQKFQRDGIPLDEAAKSVQSMLARGEAVTGDDRLPTIGDKPALNTISAVALQQKDIPPIRWIVQNFIPAGLTILASPPKLGKSWMAMALSLSTAMGGTFLGYRCHKCGCLYATLEDSERRLKSRMQKIIAPLPALPSFDFTTMAPTLSNGLVDTLEQYVVQNPDTGLIIVDTLQKVRDVGGGKDVYGRDYNDVGALKRFADVHNVAVLLIHHLRKMGDDSDPFARISGTNGLSGAADTMMVVSKERRGDDTATLNITGRDVEMQELVLRFDKASCLWQNLGNADTFAEQQARQEYQSSPIVTTIKKLLEQNPNGWRGTAKQLMEAGNYIAHRSLADTTKSLSKQLTDLEPLLLECDNILHTRRSNGSGGGKHSFTYVDAQQFTDVGEQEEIGTNPFTEQ